MRRPSMSRGRWGEPSQLSFLTSSCRAGTDARHRHGPNHAMICAVFSGGQTLAHFEMHTDLGTKPCRRLTPALRTNSGGRRPVFSGFRGWTYQVWRSRWRLPTTAKLSGGRA
jgi:hypothetical protein